MGKRVKKKAQSGHKEKRVTASSLKPVLKETNNTSKVVDDGVVVVKERNVCAHFEKAIDVGTVCSKLQSAESTGCEDCREGMLDRKGGKGKGKNGKKTSCSKATWICLQCGHFSCGGVGLPNGQQTHAIRHARQSRHPLVLQMENNNLRWCFTCSTLIPVDTLDDNGKQKDVLTDIVKLLKNESSKTTSVDVEDIWFGSGSVISDVKSENKVLGLPNGKDVIAIRGLVNLGNTCFFNSVMQNLLKIDVLREYLLTFEGSMGPLTSALKKIIIETSSDSGLRGAINPKALFGCICARASQFRGYQQQDSHELLRCLLDGLSTEHLLAWKSDNPSRENGASLPVIPTYVDAIFGGQTSSTVCCVVCGHSSVVQEPFLDLSLPLPTKKPPPKKAQPVSRTRKIKQPPKKIVRPHPKLNKEGGVDSHPTVSGCDPSSSGESSSVLKEPSVGCSSSADLVEPGVVVDNKSSESRDNNRTQPDNVSTHVSESGGQEDGAIRLDNPEPVSQSDPQEADSWLDFLVPVTQNNAEEANSWLEYLEPDFPADDKNLTMVSLESESKDVNSSEVVGVDDGDKNVKPQTTGDDREDDHPVQVRDNEVLLLTYKDDSAATVADDKTVTEMSSLAVGDEEDALDFGFGDMFDEPEVATTSSSVSNNMPGSSYVGNGYVAGNSTDSDPDEVDNTDSPVSVESCLAHFVKLELLSGEHAWHCENCSKLQQKEKRKLKNHQTSAPALLKSMSKDKCSGSQVEQAKSHPSSDCSNSDFFADSNGSSTPDENLKDHIPMQVNGFSPALLNEQQENIETESACADGINVAASSQLPDEATSGSKSVPCFSMADHIPVERLSGSEENESGEDEDDGDVNSKNVKVMRDATKRILISKSPPILTIHLKRFGQDGRGRLSKLNGHVVFKEFIDLRPYLDNRSVSESCIYRLLGVVEHSGSMRGGHYIAYVRGGKRKGRSEEESHRQRHNVWYHASDAYVRETTLEEVLRSEAYILFYEKIQL
ncbi:hypothetical protein vseg_007841 [Gypsophila vaccaria]